MDQEAVGNIVLLAIVTLISVVQNGFFAHKVEHESKTHNGRSFQRTGTLAFERVYTAKGWQRGAKTGCSTGDGDRTSFKMESKNQESCSTDRLEWEASSHPDHCILTSSTVLL